MEKDSVVLDIRKYNRLRDFENTINSNGVVKVISVNHTHYDGGYVRYNSTNEYQHMTNDEGIKEIIKVNGELGILNTELTDSINKLQKILRDNNIDANTKLPGFNETNKAVKEVKDDLSGKSIWGFIKWRRNFLKNR